MNDESARNASRLRMNACVCSHALHEQFAHTLLAREKKVGYFLNRPRKTKSITSNFNVNLNNTVLYCTYVTFFDAK